MNPLCNLVLERRFLHSGPWYRFAIQSCVKPACPEKSAMRYFFSHAANNWHILHAVNLAVADCGLISKQSAFFTTPLPRSRRRHDLCKLVKRSLMACVAFGMYIQDERPTIRRFGDDQIQNRFRNYMLAQNQPPSSWTKRGQRLSAQVASGTPPPCFLHRTLSIETNWHFKAHVKPFPVAPERCIDDHPKILGSYQLTAIPTPPTQTPPPPAPLSPATTPPSTQTHPPTAARAY